MTKKSLSASVFALLAAPLLINCGGGGSSSGSNGATGGTTPVTPPVAETGVNFALDGTTTKGLILNGYVEIADAANGGNVLISGRTSDTDGTYDLTVPASANFDGPFVKVTVSGGAGALMMCDAANGCAATDGSAVLFGATFAIDPTVSLSAIVPTPAENGNDTVNLNIFTDLAASLAQNAAVLTDASLTDANAQVTDLFGLVMPNSTDLIPVNITDGSSANADENALRAGLLSGGVLSAAFENGSNVGAALESLRNDFAANQGQLVINESVDDPALISLEDILEGAFDASEESEIASDAFDRQAARIFGDTISARASEAGALSMSDSAPSNNAPALEQAQAFVSDLQLIVEAVDSQENENNLVDFADRVEEAANLISGPAESAVETSLLAAEAMALAYDALQDDDNLTSFEANGFTVAISSVGDVLSLDIESQTVGAETVNLSLSGDLDLDVVLVDERSFNEITFAQSGENSTSITITNDAEFSGSVVNESISITVNGGEVSVDNGRIETSSEFFNPGQNPDTFESLGDFVSSQLLLFTAERVSANLDVEITENRTNGLAFEGLASAALVGPRFEREDNFTETSNDQIFQFLSFETGSVNANLDSADVSFSGRFSEGSQFVDLAFGFVANGENLSISDEPDLIELFTYSVVDNVLTFERPAPSSNSINTLISVEEGNAELEIIASNPTTMSDTTFPDGVRVLRDENDNTIVLSAILDPTAAIFRREFIRKNTDLPNLILFVQNTTIELFYSDTTPLSDEFLANPPADILDYYNQGFVRDNSPDLFCRDVFGTGVLQPTLTQESFLDPAETSVLGFVLEERTSQGVSICEESFGVSSSFTIDREARLNESAEVSGLVSLAVSQNIAGIDPDNPQVTASLYGPVSLVDNTIGGNLTLSLEFAGRTFQTDARDIAIFDDLSQPVTVTNQDGVVMVISEDANGEATGNVSVDGVVQGVITEGNGIVIVTFNDNSFVSLR